MSDNIRACELCGGMVTVFTDLAGTRSYTSVDRDWVDRMLEVHGTEEFVFDRLRRAEKIIVDLRKRLEEKS